MALLPQPSACLCVVATHLCVIRLQQASVLPLETDAAAAEQVEAALIEILDKFTTRAGSGTDNAGRVAEVLFLGRAVAQMVTSCPRYSTSWQLRHSSSARSGRWLPQSEFRNRSPNCTWKY